MTDTSVANFVHSVQRNTTGTREIPSVKEPIYTVYVPEEAVHRTTKSASPDVIRWMTPSPYKGQLTK